jgi:hypothetical protein
MNYIQNDVSICYKYMDAIRLRNKTLQRPQCTTTNVSWKNVPLREPIHQNKQWRGKYTNYISPDTQNANIYTNWYRESRVEDALGRIYLGLQLQSAPIAEIEKKLWEHQISTVLWIPIYIIYLHVHDCLENKYSTFIECKWKLVSNPARQSHNNTVIKKT